MKAELLPLSGKYYGTEIKITDDYGYEYKIELWNSGNDTPSVRELDGDSIENYVVYDNHFENKNTYELACKIVNLINKS